MAVSSVQSGGSSGSALTGATQDLGTDQFMSLLVAQIQNQDPFSPMDNQQFISQLAQFTQLEQLQGINSKLTDNMTYTQSLNNTQLMSLVGRRATVPGNALSVTAGSASPIKVQSGNGGTATVQVKNAAGQVVDTYTQDVRAGWNDLDWDGRLADGTVAADGKYTFSVSIKDRGGEAVTSQSYVTDVVDSLRFENGIAIINVAGKDYYVSDIAQVSR
jgi:flagellar basal-body rod modification protein FlgD